MFQTWCPNPKLDFTKVDSPGAAEFHKVASLGAAAFHFGPKSGISLERHQSGISFKWRLPVLFCNHWACEKTVLSQPVGRINSNWVLEGFFDTG